MLSACRNQIDIEKVFYPAPTDPQKAFADEFTSMYGLVAQDLSWITVSDVAIKIDLEDLDSNKSFDLKFYTANPTLDIDYCFLLAEYNGLKGGTIQELQIDIPTGLNYIFASAVSGENDSYITYSKILEEDVPSFVFSSETKTQDELLEQPNMKYRICYEGFTGDETLDFDYNDVVAEIEYVRGQDKAVINVLAAGCRCAAKIAYHIGPYPEKGEEITLFEEIHDALGFSGWFDNGYQHMTYPVLNTGLNTTDKIGSKTLDFDQNKGESITKIAPKLFVYFTISISKNKKDDTVTTAFIPSRPGSQYPQAILIADPDWKWPREGMLLSADYSQFRFWLAQPEKYPFWYGGKIWKEANKSFE